MKNWVIKKLNSDSYLTRSHFCNSVNSIPLMTKSWLQDAFNKMKSWFTLQLAMKVKHMKPSASSGSVFLRPPQISPKKFTSTQFHEFSPPQHINLASTSHKYSNMSFMRSGYYNIINKSKLKQLGTDKHFVTNKLLSTDFHSSNPWKI